MPKKLTTYKSPPIAERIAQCVTVDQLQLMRDGIIVAMRCPDKFSPEPRTVQAWVEAIWRKAVDLIKGAQTGEELNYIYNVMYRWEKPEHVARTLEVLHNLKASLLPSPAEREQAAGIVYAK